MFDWMKPIIFERLLCLFLFFLFRINWDLWLLHFLSSTASVLTSIFELTLWGMTFSMCGGNDDGRNRIENSFLIKIDKKVNDCERALHTTWSPKYIQLFISFPCNCLSHRLKYRTNTLAHPNESAVICSTSDLYWKLDTNVIKNRISFFCISYSVIISDLHSNMCDHHHWFSGLQWDFVSFSKLI